MTVHVTPSSRDRDKLRKDLPAKQKYKSDRITRVKALAEEQGQRLFIISRKYGVIEPRETIPFHDEMIRNMDLTQLITHTKHFLQSKDIEKVVYHTSESESEQMPYRKIVKAACDTLNIDYAESKSG